VSDGVTFSHEQPVQLLQALIRCDSTNPTSDERGCIRLLAATLQEAGFEPQIVAKDPNRPNLIARLPGDGKAPGLLLQGHVDVVPTADQAWTVPPFAGLERDGYIWGRGALDMKSGLAMMACAAMRLRAEGKRPAGDVVICFVADEEAGGDDGARYLVEEHAYLFDGCAYALGEFGGFPLYLNGRKFYPIQVAEKMACALRLTFTGPAGHGSMPVRGGTMARLGRALTALDRVRTPIHVPPAARMMIAGFAAHSRFPTNLLLRQLVHPRLSSLLLSAMGARVQMIEAVLRNTVNATIVRGGTKVNVIPSQIALDLDVRLLPGFVPEQAVNEVRTIVGEKVAIEVLSSGPPLPAEPDLAQFPLLAGVLEDLDPGGVPIPYINPGATDARHFNQLGIQSYGFTPMNLPPDFEFVQAMHGADERVPVDAVHFGTRAIYDVLCRYGRT
jgi:acetylornithine deacetylase/succinyl-diaminopimelate desuccinylase-like protein